MTQEDKELLLKVLCERLLYTPILNIHGVVGYDEKLIAINRAFTHSKYTIITNSLESEPHNSHEFDIEEVKPYLRPMSSMNVVERNDLRRLTDAISIHNDGLEFESHDGYNDYIGYCFCKEIVDWLNSHHFDYCGLIEKGLALPAPEGMYKEE